MNIAISRPGASGQDGRNVRRPFHVLLAYFRLYPLQTVLILVAFIGAGLAEGLGFISLLPLLNSILESGDTGAKSPISELVTGTIRATGLSPGIGTILVIIFVMISLKNAFRFVALRFVGNVIAAVGADLRIEIISLAMAARWSYFVNQPVGKFASAVGIEAANAAGAYQNGSQVLASAIQGIVFLGLAFSISWQVTIAAAAVGIFMLLTLQPFLTLARVAGQRQMGSFQSVSGQLVDIIQSIKPIKAMGLESLLQPILRAETNELRMAQRQQVLAKQGLRSLQEPVIIGAVCVGFFLALTVSNIPTTTLVVLAVLFHRATDSVGELQRAYQVLNSNAAFYWSIRDRCDDAAAAREANSGTLEPELRTALRMTDVSFSYGERSILNAISVEIPVGRLTALIGPSGAGKTTVVDLICGLQGPDSGGITLDGRPLSDVSLSAWRHRIGYVPQDALLLHDTLKRNVTLGDPSISDEDVEAALRMAGAWDFAIALPQGLDTVLGERGSTISGGQRQRTAIARALARKPALLILDEATASLDPATEQRLMSTLHALAGEVTIFAISHQPMIVESADLVYRIDRGKVERVDTEAQGERQRAPEGPSHVHS